MHIRTPTRTTALTNGSNYTEIAKIEKYLAARLSHPGDWARNELAAVPLDSTSRPLDQRVRRMR